MSRIAVLYVDGVLQLVEVADDRTKKIRAQIDVEGLSADVALDVGLAVDELRAHALRSARAGRPTKPVEQPRAEHVADAELMPSEPMRRLPMPTGPNTMVRVAGVLMGYSAIVLLNTIRRHPEGIGSAQLWLETKLRRQGASSALTKLQRDGFIRKQGYAHGPATYYPLPIPGVDQ